MHFFAFLIFTRLNKEHFGNSETNKDNLYVFWKKANIFEIWIYRYRYDRYRYYYRYGPWFANYASVEFAPPPHLAPNGERSA